MLVAIAHGHSIESAQDIGLHHGQLGNTIDAACIAQLHEIEPSTAAGPAGGGAEFTSCFAQGFSRSVEQFRRERPTAHAGAVRLEDTDDFTDSPWSHTQTVARPGGDGVGGRYKRIRSEIDVEHSALGTFSEDAFAGVKGFVEEVLAVDEIKCTQFAHGGHPFVFYPCQIVFEIGELREQSQVLPLKCFVAFLKFTASNVTNAKAIAASFVHVRGADSLKG